MHTTPNKIQTNRPGKSSAAGLFGDYWVKSQYEIHNDRIRPAAGATMIRYEPWDDYSPPIGKQTRTRPYQSLLTLGAIAAEHSYDSDEFKAAALDFVTKHGPLGILLHRLETIVLPQRASKANPKIPQQSAWGAFDRAIAAARRFEQTTYFRTTQGWKEQVTRSAEQKDFSGAFLRNENGMELQPLKDVCEEFFPGLESASLPLPFSEDFWTGYSELVLHFWNAASQFCNAIEDARIRPRRGQEWLRFGIGLTALGELTRPVRHNLYPYKAGKLRLGWVCHSLLAVFAMMATQDLAQNRLLRCARRDCQAYFVTQAKMAKYCSARCRKAVQMRRYRKNLAKREAK
jgi:hypothetical protein